MPIGSVTELISALSAGDFGQLLGTPEGVWLEFHRDPYAVGSDKKLVPRGKWELAKDVGAFANRDGGFIILGVKTSRHEHETGDTASEIRPITKSIVDAEAYQSVIDSWLFPRVSGVTMSWFRPEVAVTEGLFLIEVPAQEGLTKFFVLRRVIGEGDNLHEAGNLAVPLREGDRSELMSSEEVQRLISVGRQLPGTAPPRQSQTPKSEARASAVTTEIETRNGWENDPIYVLHAAPGSGGPVPIPDFYDRHGLWMALYRPDSLRPMGFNLQHGGSLEPIQGGWYAGRPEHHALWLEEDGFFTAGGVVDPDFLGWALNDRENPKPLKINPLTLVEFTYEFFRFVSRELQTRTSRQSWRCGLTCRRFVSADVRLLPGVVHRETAFLRSGASAGSDDFVRWFDSSAQPEVDAYRALELFYSLFHLSQADIPFTDDGRVSADLILAVR